MFLPESPDCEENPAPRVIQHYRSLWAQQGAGRWPVNPGLAIESTGFARCQGDWLGVLVTPWFLRLVMLPATGTLWGEIPPGQRRYVNLPGGTLAFTAAAGAEYFPAQYSNLVDRIEQVPDMASARRIAQDAWQTFVEPVATTSAAEMEKAPAEATALSRRGFFRRLAGKC